MKPGPHLVLIVSSLAALIGLLLGGYRMDIIGMCLCFGLLAASVDFSWGYCGILNLGPALSFGIGAYAVALASSYQVSKVLCIVLGVLLSVSIVCVIATIVFRKSTRVIHFGLICFALSLAFEQIFLALYSFAGGSNGITGVGRLFFQDLGRFDFVCSWFVVFTLLSVLILLSRSHFGLVQQAIQSDPKKTEMYGYSVWEYRVASVGISAAIGALAGSLYVPFVGIAHPSLFGVTSNVVVLVWVALGGQRSILGPFICAILLKVVEFELGSNFVDIYVFLLGVILILTVIVVPAGLAGTFPALRAREPWALNNHLKG